VSASFFYCPAEIKPRRRKADITYMIVTLFKTSSNGVLLYYTVHDRQAGLSQPYTLTVAWSRGSGRGREKFYVFDSLAEKDRLIRALLAKRTKAGYRLLYSFSRDASWTETERKDNSPHDGKKTARALG
jgi:hypothetical protein